MLKFASPFHGGGGGNAGTKTGHVSQLCGIYRRKAEAIVRRYKPCYDCNLEASVRVIDATRSSLLSSYECNIGDGKIYCNAPMYRIHTPESCITTLASDYASGRASNGRTRVSHRLSIITEPWLYC